MKTGKAARVGGKKNPTLSERLAQAEAEKKRLADELAAVRAARAEDDEDDEDDKKDGDEREGEEGDDARDSADADGENAAEDGEGDDAEGDDKRDADDENGTAEEEDGDEPQRAAPKGSKAVRSEVQEALRKDRERQAAIRKLAKEHGVASLGERHAARETSLTKFRTLVLDALSTKSRNAPRTFAHAGTRDADVQTGEARLSGSRDFEAGAAEARALLRLIPKTA